MSLSAWREISAFVVVVAALVAPVGGYMAAKTRGAPSAGTMPTDTPLFVGLLTGVIVILGG